MVLLVGAGLLIKTFWKLRSVEPGFAADHLLTMRVELPEARYKEVDTQTRFRKQTLDAINSLPGVSAAMASLAVGPMPAPVPPPAPKRGGSASTRRLILDALQNAGIVSGGEREAPFGPLDDGEPRAATTPIRPLRDGRSKPK